jgi:hypothetical protein
VEAAGQPFRLFRDGLDYAFIPSLPKDGSGACYPSDYPDPSAGSLLRQPVYESLQGKESWPFRTPRRCQAIVSSMTTGFAD